MKSKAQKQEELDHGAEAFGKKPCARFHGFHEKFPRRTSDGSAASFGKPMRIFWSSKKRLLAILLKEQGIDTDLAQFKTSIGTIFSRGDVEKIAGPAYAFFSNWDSEGGAKDVWVKHLLGGYDLAKKQPLDGAALVFMASSRPAKLFWRSCSGSSRRRSVRSCTCWIKSRSKQIRKQLLWQIMKTL